MFAQHECRTTGCTTVDGPAYYNCYTVPRTFSLEYRKKFLWLFNFRKWLQFSQARREAFPIPFRALKIFSKQLSTTNPSQRRWDVILKCLRCPEFRKPKPSRI